MSRATFLAAFVFLAACGSTDAASEPGAEAQGPTALADILTLDDLGVYQAVKVTFIREGELVTPNAPIIPNRPALVRVNMRAKPSLVKDRRFLGTLTVHRPGKEDVVLTDVPRRILPLDDAALHTTFNFDLEAEHVTPGMSIDVTIRDAGAPEADSVRLPAEPLRIEPGPLAPVLKVRFIPVRYDGDGSGRLPDLDEETLESYRRALFKLYPVSSVDLQVRNELAWPLPIWSDGSGWSRLLSAVIKMRSEDVVEDDVYYVAVVRPSETQGEFCSDGGCVLGIAPQANLTDVGLRVAMILGYGGDKRSSHGTLAQELAHAMGRGHAPCGTYDALDRKYPYGNASIGVFGWDLLDRVLHDPEEQHDFMSYCRPIWTSDYTFAGLYERMIEVDRTKRPPAESPVAQSSMMGTDGQRHEGPRVRVHPGAPAGVRAIPSLPGAGIVIE